LVSEVTNIAYTGDSLSVAREADSKEETLFLRLFAKCVLAVALPLSVSLAAIGLSLTGPTATGQVGQAYSSSLGATGGIPPYTFAITSGSLPTGLNLNSSTGAITGTPTVAGAFAFTASVTDNPGLPLSNSTAESARPRKAGQAAPAPAGVVSPFTITIAPAVPSGTPVPPSLPLALTGMAAAGLFRLRQVRRRS
jgi:hypothetical protein